MDYAYTYSQPTRLYLNVTNRCTNRCRFCVRYLSAGLGGATLWGGPEPALEDLLEAIEQRGGLNSFEELVWCGFGEPTFRLDLIQAAGEIFRREGRRVRLNTNGHGSLIHGRDILPELSRCVDAVSVSLNTPDADRYVELCRPDPRSVPGRQDLVPRDFWEAMRAFLRGAPAHFADVQASVVGAVLGVDELEACNRWLRSIGPIGLRVR